LLGRYPRELSGGQRQRVAMGRAIVRAPQVFLFDEPLSNLDAKLRVAMRTEIKALHQRLRTTTIYVTHDQIEAMTMADKIVVMHDGIVEQIGAPLDLYDNPANLFVASFIGSPSMNLFPGMLDFSDGKRRVLTDAGLHFDIPENEVGDSHGEVTLGVRPEHFIIDRDGLQAKVIVVEPTGPETLVTLQAGSTDIVALFKDRIAAKPGEQIRIKPHPAHVHLFDRTNGVRLGY
jgi:multiple sugar transport system ATP-binding protein